MRGVEFERRLFFLEVPWLQMALMSQVSNARDLPHEDSAALDAVARPLAGPDSAV